MLGCIRFRDVAAHPILVARGFGWRALGACLWAAATRRNRTFLDIVGCAPRGAARVDSAGAACYIESRH